MDERSQERICLAGRLRAFAVSASNLGKVASYIHHQQMHHRKMSFEEEYLGLLRKHGVGFDPRFVFD
jgi:hypothetical protein